MHRVPLIKQNLTIYISFAVFTNRGRSKTKQKTVTTDQLILNTSIESQNQ